VGEQITNGKFSMSVIRDFVAVGMAGFLGAVLRWGIAAALNRPFLPWGTLLINVSGSFALGWVMATFGPRWEVSETARVAVAVGFLGSFTTFSSLMFETNSRVFAGASWVGMGYLAGSIVLGLVAVRAGVLLGQVR
jgi:CrcB protein